MTEQQKLTGGRMHLPRSRGALSGIVLIILGAWGALAPFIGPYFDFAFTPAAGDAWHWTQARGWFEVAPGAVTLIGGLLLLVSANRAVTSFGAWAVVAAGGWFVVGPQVAPLVGLGTLGVPANGGQTERIAISLIFFAGLGAVIVLFGALAAGRLSVRSVRDARVAARRDAREQQAEDERLAAEQETERQNRFRSDNGAQRTADATFDHHAAAAGAENTGAPTPGDGRDDHVASRSADQLPQDGRAASEPLEQRRSASETSEAAPEPSTGNDPSVEQNATGPSDTAGIPSDGAAGHDSTQRSSGTDEPAPQITVAELQRDHPVPPTE